MKTRLYFRIMTSILLLFASGIFAVQAKNVKKPLPHVLIIGIDGLGAYGVGMANTPHLDELMENGSYSLAARTIMPTSSGPAWSSMITETTVERHWVGNKSLEPVYKGKYNMFATIFGEIRDRVPVAVIGAIYHWKSFGNFIEPSVSCESEDEHGDLEKRHGGTSPDEMIVPLFISGKEVKKECEIDTPVFTYDLAPTVSCLFGFKLNDQVGETS